PVDPTSYPLDHLTLRGSPNAVALIDREGTLNYSGLEAHVGALAARLRARVPDAGARVASWLPKTRMTCLLPLACARAGLVHVPFNPLLKHAQVSHRLADSGAALLITGSARAATLELGDAPPGCAVATEEEAAAMLAEGEGLPPSDADP